MHITTFPAEGYKKTLSIDSFSKILSVAVSNGKEIYYAETNPEMRHSELAMEIIDNLMNKAALTPSDLQGVLCMAGPGSFTGLRIGYSIAKGLALCLSIPFAAIPTLYCIAYQKHIEEQSLVNNDSRPPNPDSRFTASDSPIILTLIEARKNSYFYAFFKNNQRLTPDKEGDSAEITEEIKQYCFAPPFASLPCPALTGPASAGFYDSLPQELKEKIVLRYENKGYANELLHIANIRKILDNDTSMFLYAGPEYIRESDAQASLSVKTELLK